MLMRKEEESTVPTEVQEHLLSLLAHELFQCELSTDTASVDWSAVLDEGDRHAVTALLFPSIMQLPNLSDGLMSRICGTAVSASHDSEELMHAQQEILALLERKGISYAVLKGTSLACLYPHPELRVLGDIDLLFTKETVAEACNVLYQQGFVKTHTSEKHICLEKQGVSVEMHSMVSVFPESEKGLFARKFMTDALQHTEIMHMGEYSFPALSGMYQIISLLAHMDQHLATEGIGLRQLCDWAVAVDAQRLQIGAEQLALLEQCGLMHFAKVVTKICEKYLALPPFPWCADMDESLADALMADMLEGGNFQSNGQQRPFGGVLTDAYNVENGTRNSVVRNYFQYVRKRVKLYHPWAKSILWVIPFSVFYPARWTVRMLLGKRRKFSVKQAVHSAKKREKLLRELHLYQ